jgi:hypothetical protein
MLAAQVLSPALLPATEALPLASTLLGHQQLLNPIPYAASIHQNPAEPGAGTNDASPSGKLNPHVPQKIKLLIVDFGAVQETSTMWTFRGQVVGATEGSTVQLGGLPSLRGCTATVGANGWFSISVQLKSGECGTATAQATDAAGDVSNLARALVGHPD